MNKQLNPEFPVLPGEEFSKYYNFDEIFPSGLSIDRFKVMSFAEAKLFAHINGTFYSDRKLIVGPELSG